jgi:uncharacterized protein YqeY
MPLAVQLENDLKDAMRAGDARRRDVIRFLRAAIKNASIERRRELTDDEILSLVRYQIKQRRDSIEQFRKGNRADLADEEEAQIAILEPYLPTQMDDTELQAITQRIAADLNVNGPRDMSKLMPALMAATEGRADGRRLSEAARAELARRAAEPQTG